MKHLNVGKINLPEVIHFENKFRLANKNKWYQIDAIVDNKPVNLKAYNTWLQIYRVGHINHSNCMERTVKQFKLDLMVPFE